MPFTDETLNFLKQLKKNNKRDWFEKNKLRYESVVREPAFEFIEAVGPLLKKVSPHFQAIAKKSGGSLMRVYRDTRFSKDKTPYKTNIGIHFRHEMGKSVHAPGYYVHLAPDENFLGLGIWRPDSATLKKIRTHIQEEPAAWRRATGGKAFRSSYKLEGDSLKIAPLGIDKNDPLIEDLKRKDFIGVNRFSFPEALQHSFAKNVVEQFKAGRMMMRFLCDALKIPF